MFKVAIDGGHAEVTPGKRTPDGEREWSFNNKVVLALIAELKKYSNVEIIRTDDPTGKTDVSLEERVRRANNFGADVFVSIHHNANSNDGRWGTWTGSETYLMTPVSANPGSYALAKAVHPQLVKAMGLRDRGIKAANFHVLRETNMPAILTEAGYMDSTIDIDKLRNNSVLATQGRNIAKGIAAYGKLSLTPAAPVVAKPKVPLYRVRKSWADAKSQKGAYAILAGAKALADKHPGHSVFNEDGKNVYDPQAIARKAEEERARAAELARQAAAKAEYENQYKKAIELGITDGTNPDDPPTRKQTAVMIVRALELK